MTHRLTKQPRGATPTYRHQPHPSSSCLLSLSSSNFFLSNSSSSHYSYSPFSFSSLFTALLFIALLQSPHIAKGKAVALTKNNVQEEFAALSPPNSFSASCDDEHGEDDPLTQLNIVQELKANMLKHHGLEESSMGSPESAALLNGTHPEGRKVRQRLRNLVRSKTLDAGITEMEIHTAEGTQLEKYVFHSSGKFYRLKLFLFS